VAGLIALAIAGFLMVRLLQASGGNPTGLAAFGEKARPTLEYAAERLGEVVARAGQGHDGKFFFVQGNDPWLADPEGNAAVLDRPVYRSQRMLYPLLAGGFGALPPQAVIWAMPLLNMAAILVGTVATGRLAQSYGRSPLWGLLFVVNIGILSELFIGGAGAVAMALSMVGLLAVRLDRIGLAAGSFAGAVLAREVVVILVAGVAVWLLLGGRRRAAAAVAGVPLLATVAWGAYVRLRLADIASGTDVQEIGWPFVGMVQAASGWSGLGAMAALAVVGMGLILVLRVYRAPSLLGLAFVGFVPLITVLTRQVWQQYFDITRAAAPILMGFVLVAFVEGPATRLRWSPPRRRGLPSAFRIIRRRLTPSPPRPRRHRTRGGRERDMTIRPITRNQ
jgi:hypothetical protein